MTKSMTLKSGEHYGDEGGRSGDYNHGDNMKHDDNDAFRSNGNQNRGGKSEDNKRERVCGPQGRHDRRHVYTRSVACSSRSPQSAWHKMIYKRQSIDMAVRSQYWYRHWSSAGHNG